MSSLLPVQLSGNLSHRHRCINDLVHQTFSENVPFHAIQDLPEESTIDRLFKIDLATKHKNVDYILDTLKGDDMLYVARALKSTWLLQRQYSHIFNPQFLEKDLYPQLRLQAINKMKNWIQLHLRDPERCSSFYTFYKDRDFNLAAKFLNNCSNVFILNEFNNISDKITPKLLKRLSEKVPQVTRIYFASLKENQTLLANYLKKDRQFFDTVKYVLKSDPDIFFYVIENFFVIREFPSFSSEVTKYIMKNHKARFMNKPELYTWQFLHIETIAKCLNPEEIKDLIRLLAKAQYLSSWFSYQNIEPFIKSLSIEERTAIKQQIFVDKDFGATVQEWPYALPDIPKLQKPQNGLFKDKKVKPWGYCDSYSEYCDQICAYDCGALKRAFCRKTLLDELFDEYRFKNYSQTLTDLQKRVRAESSSQNRQYMLLVLISKTGGRLEDLISFLDLLRLFKNEPVHIRATIIRSLVKRAFVWRLPPEYWTILWEWARGLGLDGSTPEAACSEGLHAVVMRDILANVISTPEVWKAFLDDFSTFVEYKLTADEHRVISSRFPALLLAESGLSLDKAAERIDQLLDTLAAYRIRFDQYPGTVEAIMEIAKRDVDSAKPLLQRMYSAKIARKTLFKENFKLIPTDTTYVNALRHDCSLLDDTEYLEKIVKDGSIPESFLRKLALYFAEKNGLAQRYCIVLESLASKSINDTKNEQIKIIKLGRPLALLAGSTFPSLLSKFSYEPGVRNKTTQQKNILAAILRANSHEVRPPFEIESFGWKTAGAKAVANRAMTCRHKDVEQILQKTLSWGRTLRLSLLLAERVNKTRESYEIVVLKRPKVALKCALRYFKRRGNNSNPEIWKIVRLVMEKYYLTSRSNRSNDLINKLNIPLAFKADFCVILFKAYKKASIEIPTTLFSCLIDVLPEVDESFLLNEIKDFLQTDLAFEIQKKNDYEFSSRSQFYFDIIAKYLILSTSNEMAEQRLQNVGNLFFNRIEDVWKQFAKKNDSGSVTKVLRIIDNFLCSLKYSIVFFDTKYACLPVFESLCQWLHSFLPIEKWFDLYSKVHLTVIYFKAVRLCLENSPQTFADESKKLKEGVKMLGITYGKLINNAIEDLTQKYYPSIISLYKDSIESFINFLCSSSDESTDKFKLAVIKGILSEQQLSSQIVALRLFLNLIGAFGEDPYLEDIKNIFKVTENDELRFLIQTSYLAQNIDFEIK